MFNPQLIISGFAGLVGFTQSFNPNYPTIKNSLTLSSSGYKVQQAHPLVDLENLVSAMPEIGYNVYPAWVDQDYVKDSLVKSGEKIYKAKNAVPEGTASPDLATTFWEETNEFSEWLQDIYNQSCLDVCNDVVNQKKLKNMGKSILDSLKMYEGVGQYYDRIVKTGRFCAIRFKLASHHENLSIQMDKVGFQYDTAEPVTFYLYHSSQTEPIKTWTVDFSKVSSFEWFGSDQFPGFDMLTSSSLYDTGGSFYFGYYEDSLTGQVIEKKFNVSRPCHSCSPYNSNAFRSWSKHVNIQSVYVKPADLNGTLMFDEADLWVADNTNFGLNFHITVKCDVSNFFVRHKTIFADALNKQIALNIIKKVAFNTRINAISDKVKAYAQGELDNAPNVGSFYNDVLNTYKSLNFDFSGFDSECLPCTGRGFRKGAI